MQKITLSGQDEKLYLKAGLVSPTYAPSASTLRVEHSAGLGDTIPTSYIKKRESRTLSEDRHQRGNSAGDEGRGGKLMLLD